MLGMELNEGQRELAYAIMPYIQAKEFPLRCLFQTGNQLGKTTFFSLLAIWFQFTKYTFLPHTFTGKEWSQLEYTGAVIAPMKSLMRAMFSSVMKIVNGRYLISPRIDRGETEYHMNQTRIKGFIYRYSKSDSEGLGQIPTIYFANNSTMEFYTMFGSRGDTLQGSNYPYAMYDEFGRDDNLDEEIPDIYNRLQTLRGPLFMMTTPSEKHPTAVQFIDEITRKKSHKFKVFSASALKNEYKNKADIMSSVSGLSDAQRRQIIEGIASPFGATFFPVQSITDAANITEIPKIDPKHTYYLGLDTAMMTDKIGIQVIDVTELPYKQVFRSYIKGKDQKLEDHLSTIRETYYNYPNCTLVIDCSNEAGYIWLQLLSDLNPTPFRFGTEKSTGMSTKIDMLSIIRRCLENKHLDLQEDDYIIKRQLTNYRLDDSGLETDGLMALGVAVYYPYKEYLVYADEEISPHLAMVERF
jgi:hypothetical protein